jgi:hypothetical protein
VVVDHETSTDAQTNTHGTGGEGRADLTHLDPLQQIVPCHARHAVVSDDQIHIDLLQKDGGEEKADT